MGEPLDLDNPRVNGMVLETIQQGLRCPSCQLRGFWQVGEAIQDGRPALEITCTNCQYSTITQPQLREKRR